MSSQSNGMELQEPGVNLQSSQSSQQANNIAKLYSQLQAAFDKNDPTGAAGTVLAKPSIQTHNHHHTVSTSSSSSPFHKGVTEPPMSMPSSTRSSSESDTTSSPITPHQQHSQLLMTRSASCACHHWLVSVDSEHCGICDTPLPELQQWQDERHLRFQTIDRTTSQFERLAEKEREQQEQIEQLTHEIQMKQAAIEKRTSELQSVKLDLEILQTKCHGERQQVKQIQQSKESVKRELEELSQRLFEEAHEMMAHEKAEKDKIEQDLVLVRQLLEEAESDLTKATTELDALRHQLQQKHNRLSSSSINNNLANTRRDDHHPDIDHNSAIARAQIDLATQQSVSKFQIVASADNQCLTDFRHFIDSASQVPLRKLHSLPYMKHLIDDDIKPTLRFGPNPRMGSTRKIMESILVKTCFVETCPAGFPTQQIEHQIAMANHDSIGSIWERFSSSSSSTAVFYGCQACGRSLSSSPEEREKVLVYRFRTSYFEDWTCIDRHCRDRLESVIQLYAFLRQLRIGAYRQRSLTDLYEEYSRLRLQMLMSR
ncbi:hypothetical protein BX666DRAFT_1978798 [Dichotomocladium elegans]|nr:hypothetical protein BX666DRAFT_1978798 [Dichotomocladium elegans]